LKSQLYKVVWKTVFLIIHFKQPKNMFGKIIYFVFYCHYPLITTQILYL